MPETRRVLTAVPFDVAQQVVDTLDANGYLSTIDNRFIIKNLAARIITQFISYESITPEPAPSEHIRKAERLALNPTQAPSWREYAQAAIHVLLAIAERLPK